MAGKGSKNAPSNRGVNTNVKKVVLVIKDGKKKMCVEKDGKLYDKKGNEIT